MATTQGTKKRSTRIDDYKALKKRAERLTAESTTGAWYGVTTDRNGLFTIVCVPGR